MSVTKEINWEEFDRRKLSEGGDHRYFSFKDWEIDFLVSEIGFVHPEISEIKVLRAILSCCETIKSPFPKVELYQCVMDKLKNLK